MTVNDISSAILNDLFSGNFIDTQDQSVLSIEQLEDEVLEERAAIIKELFLKKYSSFCYFSLIIFKLCFNFSLP